MASEITRIATATDFNGIHLLDGSLSGAHDGSGLNATGRMKIHFGTGNDSAEDYYYIEIGCCTAKAFGLGNDAYVDGTQTITVTEIKPKEPDYTLEYYLTLREKAADSAYNKTFVTYYNDKLSELGVPYTDDKKNEARQYAEPFANNDRNTVTNNFDKIYNDEYANAFEYALNNYINKDGMTIQVAEALADADAIKAAILKVIDVSKTVVNDNNVSSLVQLDAMPAKTEDNASTLMNQAKDFAYNNAYNAVYSDLYNKAIKYANDQNINGTIDTLSEDQIRDIKEKVSESSDTIAESIAEKIRNELQSIYDTAKNTASGTENEKIEYAYDAIVDAIKSGDAENRVSPDDFTTEIKIDTETEYPRNAEFEELVGIIKDSVNAYVRNSLESDIILAAGTEIKDNLPDLVAPAPSEQQLTENQINTIKGDTP